MQQSLCEKRIGNPIKPKGNGMKKFILSLLGLTVLAACSGYDYYKTNVRYRQSGEDCIYYYTEKGKKFNEDIRNLKDVKKVVYRNTQCSELYNQDSFGYTERSRVNFAPAVVEEVKPVAPCGCGKCAKKQVLKNRYVVVAK